MPNGRGGRCPARSIVVRRGAPRLEKRRFRHSPDLSGTNAAAPCAPRAIGEPGCSCHPIRPATRSPAGSHGISRRSHRPPRDLRSPPDDDPAWIVRRLRFQARRKKLYRH
ncbi:hypothetical protein Maq22A_c27860 [Methylobacterium aquaticum]|uniref:Uncharacterized protein n=1 Tax=Methylobacterium aquaticum TaxID=270351 RepID=A0A1Y0Z8N6_9HYPH|nr:hypothetical protein Maq22A_c27860 [Methylobacterium aquaticum]